MSRIISLTDRHTDATRELMLSTAIELLETAGVTDLTVRAVAKKAGMSERTIFRYFPSRDEFLDAIASEAAVRMRAPLPPRTIKELLNYPRPLYNSFEERSSLVRAALHTEIFDRVRVEAAQKRWHAVAQLIDEIAAHRKKKDRIIATTNISYYLSASTWNYYRSNFQLSLKDSIDCAKTSIGLTLNNIQK